MRSQKGGSRTRSTVIYCWPRAPWKVREMLPASLSDGKRVTKARCLYNSPIMQASGDALIDGIISPSAPIHNQGIR